jgi:hypothetical protein
MPVNMANKKEIKSPKPKEVKGEYKISFIFPDKTYTVDSVSILEGLSSIKPEHIKGKCIIRAEKNGKSTERVFYPALLRKFLVNKNFKVLTDKRFSTIIN